MKKVRLATVWLDGCAGCHMSLLDIDEAIAVVARSADVVYGPLVDAQEFPENVDVTLVEGAVSSHEDLEKAKTIRQRSKLVIALGDCAVTSNVPAMRNPVPVKQLLDRVYLRGPDPGTTVPSEVVPPLLRQAMPLHRYIKVDLHVPGCPPPADAIFHVLTQLLEGKVPDLAGAKFG